MRIIKTIGFQYISDTVAPTSPPPDVDRPALFHDTVTFNEYRWDVGTQAWIGIPRVYRARLTQSGVADPTALVLENNLIGTITWTRASLGVYNGNLSVPVTYTKGFAIVGFLDPVNIRTAGVLFSGTKIVLTTFDADASPLYADGMLLNTPIELLVYP